MLGQQVIDRNILQDHILLIGCVLEVLVHRDGTFEQLLTAADDVLSAVGFTGTGSFLAPGDLKGKNNPLVPLAEEALFLYEIIDDYNNSEICTGEPSH